MSARPKPSARPPALPRDAMKGPKRAAVAILVFFGSSLLGVHLAYDLRPAPAATPADAPIPAPPVAVVAVAPAPAPAEAPGAGPATAEPPTPVPAADVDLNACVERALRASGAREEKAVLPGRWPALKRAREVRRQRRLALGTECERALSLGRAAVGPPLTIAAP